jgi:HEAT repeat protein
VIGILVIVTAVLAAATSLLALVLLAVKAAHRLVINGRRARVERYVGVVGDMISLQLVPPSFPTEWVFDTSFHDTLIDYGRLLTGDDRRHVDHIAAETGVVAVLRVRSQGGWRMRRLRALATLVELAGPEEIPFLMTLLDDHNTYVRAHAAHGLARLRELAAIPAILELSKRVSPWEAARLADSLVEFGPRAAPTIVEWVQREFESSEASLPIIAQAVRVLGLIGDPVAAGLLIELLSSPFTPLRLAATSALGRIAIDDARDPLLRALGDDSWEVRARAAKALAALADPTVAPSIAALLTDRQWWVRQNAAEALAQIPGGVASLRAALDLDDPYAVDAAATQLIELGLLDTESHQGETVAVAR